MKKISFIYCLLLCSHLTFSQVKETVVNHILNNTSVKKSYAVLVKNYDDRISFVWSNDLLDYYKDKNCNKANAIKIVKRKLLVGDTFNIISSNKISVGAIDSVKLNQLSNDASKGLQFFITKYFKGNQLNPIYSDFVKEVSFCLWKKQTYLFVGLDNGSLPSIGVLSNKIITNSKAENGIVRKTDDKEVEFYFPKYDYYLSMQKPDTSFLYLKLSSKRTDVQRLSPKLYNGEYEYAKFSIDNAKKIITVELYDDMQKFKLKEIYKYNDVRQQQEETFFYSLTSTTKIITHKIIIPILLTN